MHVLVAPLTVLHFDRLLRREHYDLLVCPPQLIIQSLDVGSLFPDEAATRILIELRPVRDLLRSARVLQRLQRLVEEAQGWRQRRDHQAEAVAAE